MNQAEKKNTATIRLDRFFPHPPRKVWRVLTEPALLERWWAPGDIAPVVGHRFELDMGKWGKVACEVLAVDPERRIAFTFGDWTITWTLSEEGAGTRMQLEQAGIDLDDPKGRFAFENMGRGWRDEVLPRIDEVLAEMNAPATALGA